MKHLYMVWNAYRNLRSMKVWGFLFALFFTVIQRKNSSLPESSIFLGLHRSGGHLHYEAFAGKFKLLK